MYFNKRAFLHNCKAIDFVSWTCKIRGRALSHMYAGLVTQLDWD